MEKHNDTQPRLIVVFNMKQDGVGTGAAPGALKYHTSGSSVTWGSDEENKLGLFVSGDLEGSADWDAFTDGNYSLSIGDATTNYFVEVDYTITDGQVVSYTLDLFGNPIGFLSSLVFPAETRVSSCSITEVIEQL